MIDRYTLPQMKKLWSEENKFRKWLEIELLACEAQVKLGNIPKSALGRIRKKVKFDVRKINQIENKTKHDVIAFLTNLAEYVGKDSKYIHLGMTSYDVVDTALSLLLKEAGNIILKDLEELNLALKVLLKKRDEDKSELEEKITSNVNELIFPYLEKLNTANCGKREKTFLESEPQNPSHVNGVTAFRISHGIGSRAFFIECRPHSDRIGFVR